MMRVLFVDDEPRILEGLEALLRKLRRRWVMDFALGGERALDAISRATYDVVVTDLRMPRVDGLAILEHLQEHHAATVRVILSGEPERNSALKLAPYAHQSLTKPCRPAELEAVLERAIPLRDLVGNPAVRRVLGSIRELPPLPRTFAALTAALGDERACLRDVADVIVSDIAVSAKVLKFANSAFFGAGRAVKTVIDAVSVLGIEAVKAFTLTTAVFEAAARPPAARVLAEDLHEHSMLVASLASTLARESRREVFATAMLHDLGKMVLATQMPSGAALETDEDTYHAKVGAYLLALWGLPAAVIDAVAGHHEEPTAETSVLARTIREAEIIADAAAVGASPTATDLADLQRLAVERAMNRPAERTEVR
jgi:putative nucleotidyltransferase with HDIG domain